MLTSLLKLIDRAEQFVPSITLSKPTESKSPSENQQQQQQQEKPPQADEHLSQQSSSEHIAEEQSQQNKTDSQTKHITEASLPPDVVAAVVDLAYF